MSVYSGTGSPLKIEGGSSPNGFLIEKNMGHFAEDQDDNAKLKEMKHQLKEMDHDYDVMLRERIESKKQLEAKF